MNFDGAQLFEVCLIVYGGAVCYFLLGALFLEKWAPGALRWIYKKFLNNEED